MSKVDKVEGASLPDRASGPHVMIDECGDEVPRPIITLEEYDQIQDRLELLVTRAELIANVLCTRSASFERFERGTVVYSYNNSCSCHAEECKGSFPAEYLFDPDWEANHLAAVAAREAEAARKAQAAKVAAAEKAAAKKARAEREEYERLKRKFEGGDGDWGHVDA